MKAWEIQEPNYFQQICWMLQCLMQLSEKQENTIVKKIIEDIIDSVIELLKYYK